MQPSYIVILTILALSIGFTLSASDIGQDLVYTWASLWCSGETNDECIRRVEDATSGASSVGVFIVVMYILARMFGYVA